MSSYRLRPTTDGTWWLALFGLTAGVLLLPAFLLPVIPKPDDGAPVELGSHGYSWSIPLDMSCRRTGDILTREWACGDVRVKSEILTGSTDRDRTLRRTVRSTTLGPLPTADILRDGEARMLVDHDNRAVGLTLQGTGDRESQTMAAVLVGPGDQMAPLADTIWRKYTGQGLPGNVTDAIREVPASQFAPAEPARELVSL